MTKEDRYAHLGERVDDETDAATDNPETDDATDTTANGQTSDGGIRVSVSDGEEQVAVTLDDADVSVDELADLLDDADDIAAATGAEPEAASEDATGTGSDTASGHATDEDDSDDARPSPLARSIRAPGYVPRAVLRSSQESVTAGIDLVTRSLRRTRQD